MPALRALQAICNDGHGEYLHFGPTTQDVLDTGVMLQIKQAHAIFKRDLQHIGRELYRLAERHKDTPMAGRTHGVQALPVTFGHKCAIWLAETGRNVYDCITPDELALAPIMAARTLIEQEPNYAFVSARLLPPSAARSPESGYCNTRS